jgi:hypothetical protein
MRAKTKVGNQTYAEAGIPFVGIEKYCLYLLCPVAIGYNLWPYVVEIYVL